MSTEEQTRPRSEQRPFFTELHKHQEDAVSAINKLERIADAVFGPAPTNGEEKHLAIGEAAEASVRAHQISEHCHDLARRFSALVGDGVAVGLPQVTAPEKPRDPQRDLDRSLRIAIHRRPGRSR